MDQMVKKETRVNMDLWDQMVKREIRVFRDQLVKKETQV